MTQNSGKAPFLPEVEAVPDTMGIIYEAAVHCGIEMTTFTDRMKATLKQNQLKTFLKFGQFPICI